MHMHIGQDCFSLHIRMFYIDVLRLGLADVSEVGPVFSQFTSDELSRLVLLWHL